MIDFILICLSSSLACVGVRLGMEEGMIFYRVRKIYLELSDEVERERNRIALYKLKTNNLKGLQVFQFIFKPISGCVTCMASVWGLPFFIVLNCCFVSPTIPAWQVLVIAVTVIGTMNNIIHKVTQ